MAANVGYGGDVKVGANVVASVEKWTFNGDKQILETTALSSSGGFRSYIPGLVGATANISAYYDNADTNGQVSLVNAWLNGTSVTLALDTLSTGTNRTWSGTAYIEKIKKEVTVAGVTKVDFDAKFTGTFTFA